MILISLGTFMYLMQHVAHCLPVEFRIVCAMSNIELVNTRYSILERKYELVPASLVQLIKLPRDFRFDHTVSGGENKNLSVDNRIPVKFREVCDHRCCRT